MRLTLPRHRFTLVLPALVVILLASGAWAMFPRASADQPPAPAEGQDFLKSARRAIAHGRISEAESLAKARPGSDSGGRRRAGASWRSDAASTRKRRRCSNRLLPRNRKGRRRSRWASCTSAGASAGRQRFLTAVQRQASSRSDPEALFRAARAAQALFQCSRSERDLPRVPAATIRRCIQGGGCSSSRSISAAKRCARSKMR